MKTAIISCLIAGMFLPLTVTEEVYVAPVVTPKIEVKATKKPRVVYQPPTELIEKYATKHNVSPETMTKIIACESSYNPRAWNKNDPNGGSMGIAQFQTATFYGHAKELKIPNPDIWDTEQQIQVMAYMISKGKARHWTCARTLNLV
jgi:hypothetical protein